MTKTASTPARLAVAGGAALLLAFGAAAPAGATASPAVAGARGHQHSADPVQLGAGFRPEGVESGPGDTYYAGSLADGRIATGDLSRGTTRILTPGVPGRQVRGLFLDRRSGLLWAAGNDGTTRIVLAVDARTGAVRHRIEVPGATFLNDLVISGRTLWVTDSRVDRLTRIPLDRDGDPIGGPTFLPLGGAWPNVTATGNSANGIRALRDGTLVLNNSTAGGLWAVSPRTGAATAVPVTGGTLTGGDGLELVGNTLYNVRGSGQQEVSVLRLRYGKNGLTASFQGVLTSPDLDVPSTATFAKGRLWAVNARFGVADPATATYAIVPLHR